MRAYGVIQSIVPPVPRSPTRRVEELEEVVAWSIGCGVVLLPFSFSSTGAGANRKPATLVLLEGDLQVVVDPGRQARREQPAADLDEVLARAGERVGEEVVEPRGASRRRRAVAGRVGEARALGEQVAAARCRA